MNVRYGYLLCIGLMLGASDSYCEPVDSVKGSTEKKAVADAPGAKMSSSQTARPAKEESLKSALRTYPWRSSARFRPQPPAGPLRYENISDIEVREIQRAAASVDSGAMIYIAGVVVGCGCAEGPTCSNQIWVNLYHPAGNTGLQLSKIDGHWKIGVLQDWWLRYDAFLATEGRQNFSGPDGPAKQEAYFTAQRALYEQFPMCEDDKKSKK